MAQRRNRLRRRKSEHSVDEMATSEDVGFRFVFPGRQVGRMHCHPQTRVRFAGGNDAVRDVHRVLNDVFEAAVGPKNRRMYGCPEFLREATARLGNIVLDDGHLLRPARGQDVTQGDFQQPLFHGAHRIRIVWKCLQDVSPDNLIEGPTVSAQ